MTANDILEASAVRLRALFPDRQVFFGEVHENADGNHSIRCVEQSYQKQLDRRRTWLYTFEITYFRTDKDELEWNAWAETMDHEFETLIVDERLIHLTGANAKTGEDGVFRFAFHVRVTELLSPAQNEPMENLKSMEGIKT